MLKRIVYILFAFSLVFIACSEAALNDIVAETQKGGESSLAEPLPVLRPSVAGSFYPSDEKLLRQEIQKYLGEADPVEIDGEMVAVIVPHAGYIYSAPVAAYAYKAMARQYEKLDVAAQPEAIIILAFSHRGGFPYLSVYYKGAVETPLGRVAVHEEIARKLIASDSRLSFSQRVYAGEHSMEVQVPFVQTIYPDTPIVPIIFGWQNMENIEAVCDALEKIAGEHRIIVVATTDLCHYNPYEVANAMDEETINRILGANARRMAEYVSAHNDRLCGPGPTIAAICFAKSQSAQPIMLKYANSGDTAGRKDAVVGYGAVAFVRNNAKNERNDIPITGKPASESDSDYLTENDRAILLQLARHSVESFVREQKILTVDPPESDTLKENGAAFVTLHKNGQLRGCIGHLMPMEPLYKTVINMAVAAAAKDHRFPPVREEELENIHIEISVNTPLRPVSGAEEIILGEHGVVVEKGLRRGVFLPQVATETGWTKKQFLENLCAQKAGLAPDAYKGDADLFVFNSIIFSEKD